MPEKTHRICSSITLNWNKEHKWTNITIANLCPEQQRNLHRGSDRDMSIMNTCQSRFVLILSYPNISEKVQDNSKIFISRQLKTVTFYFEEPPPNKHTHQISQKKVNGHRKLRNKKARMNKMQNNHKFRKHGMTWSTEPSAPLKFLGTISDSSWELSGKW